MESFALLLTGLVLCLTAAAIVGQLLRWRTTHRDESERWGRAIHDDPRWQKWSALQPDDDNRR